MNELIEGIANGIIIGAALGFLISIRKEIREWVVYQVKKYTYIIRYGSPFDRK